MNGINSITYDKCRQWIHNQRQHGVSWEMIKYAKKKSLEGLNYFLKTKIEDEFWPNTLTSDIWIKVVKSQQDEEKRSEDARIIGGQAALMDETQDSGAEIPVHPRSSWQSYKNHLLTSGFKHNSVDEIENSTLSILRRLSNDTREIKPVKGLVIGHVQSGKTANMAALMAMAADYGWNFFIVLSGTIENLREQTEKRLLQDLDRPGNLNWRALSKLSDKSSYIHQISQLHLNDSSHNRYFTVCLKNATRLRNLIKWMRNDPNKYQQLKVVVIDDEADQASINTKQMKAKVKLSETTTTEERKQIEQRNQEIEIENQEIESQNKIIEENRTIINQLIIDLVENLKLSDTSNKTARTMKVEHDFKPRAMNYISYTATPYANILNESIGHSLYPRNFIRTLTPSDEYFGPKQIFGLQESDDYNGLNIIRTIPKEEVNSIKSIHTNNQSDINQIAYPKAFEESVLWFLCAAAAMRHLKHTKPISMLVHTSQKQAHHDAIAQYIRFLLKESNKEILIKQCRDIWNKEKMKFTKDDFLNSYEHYGRNSQLHEYPEFNLLVKHILEIVNNITFIPLNEDGKLDYQEHIHLCIDNCANNGITDNDQYARLIYPDKPLSFAPVFIVVGGSTLSRGLTIEGLVSTYFLRNSCQADSLMQMGRWFGYRRGYELLPRIWMTKDTQAKFKQLTSIEADLREEIQRFMYEGLSPSQFGPRVKTYPKVTWLKLTTTNKSQGAVKVDMDYSGTNNQTTLFDNNKDILKSNIEVTEKFIDKINSDSRHKGQKSHSESAYFWTNVDYNLISEELLKLFKFQKNVSFANELSAFDKYVNQLTTNGKISNWNVILVGKGKIGNHDDSVPTWNFNFGKVGLVERSRKITNKNQEVINIGVLRGPSDVFADIDFDSLSLEDQRLVKSNGVLVKQVNEIRNRAGVGNCPQLIIYRIDKNSKPRKSEKIANKKIDLDAVEDLVGICIIMPGTKTGEGRVTVEIPSEIIVNDWENEE